LYYCVATIDILGWYILWMLCPFKKTFLSDVMADILDRERAMRCIYEKE
jgi:hypothetical protein